MTEAVAQAIPWWGAALIGVCVLAALVILFVGLAICAIVAVGLIFGKDPVEGKRP